MSFYSWSGTFSGQMPFLVAKQVRQSAEDICRGAKKMEDIKMQLDYDMRETRLERSKK